MNLVTWNMVIYPLSHTHTHTHTHTQLLLPEDMVNPHIDELSMMTYLSQFPEAELKPGAPIRKSGIAGDPEKVKVYGPGVESDGIDTNTPSADFTVDTRETGGEGKVTVTVETSEGPLECTVEDKRNGTYNCSYIPTCSGLYSVSVTYNGQPAAQSPYKVNIAPGVDTGACFAYGPGVEGIDIRAASPTEFWVETAGAGQGDLVIAVRGPKGVLPKTEYVVSKETDVKYHVEYTAQQPGPHTVEVTFAGLHIRDSPFRVQVKSDRPDANKCRAEGPGVEPVGVEIGKETRFDVHTKGAGQGDLSVHIKGPKGTVEAKETTPERGVSHFTYTPVNAGEHVITIKYAGVQIPGSRFKVQVEPETDESKVVASGPGLAPQGVRVHHPARFTVKTKDAGHGEVDVTIMGPDGEVPYQIETGPYTYNYTYEATEPGDYTVDVKFADQHVPGSTFSVGITDPNKVKITGPGMAGEYLPVNEPLRYQVDARGAGPGEVKCVVTDAGALQQLAEDQADAAGPVVTANGDGTYEIEYTPTNAALQRMNVTFGESAIPNTPIKLNVFDVSKVNVYGPGLEPGNKSGELTHFFVDMRKAGEGRLHVGLGGPVNTPVAIKDQANNVVKCEYTPAVPGEYVIDIQYEGYHVPSSPFHVEVLPSSDPNAVKAYGPGLGTDLTTDMWTEFFVDYKKAGDGEVAVTVNGPGGGEQVEEEQVEEGLKKYRYYIDPDEAGDYQVAINFADLPIQGSPFIAHANWKTNPSRVKAYGQGLEGGFTGEWAEFKLDMSTAGEGSLDLNIEGPCEAQVDVQDHDDGTATVKYLPLEAGEYKINIQFADETIPGSAFTPVFKPITDASKVKAYGPGLECNGIKIGDPGDFVIDTQEAGAGAVDVVIDGPYWKGRSPTPVMSSPSPTPGGGPSPAHRVKSPSGSLPRRRVSSAASAKPHITSNNNDTYNVKYNPRRVGTYKINVYFADQAIPESPYTVNITNPEKVKISGPGTVPEGTEDEVQLVSMTKTPLVWTVDCTEAGPGKLEATLVGPDDLQVELDLTPTEEDVYSLKYEPEVAGRYRLLTKYSGNEVPQSPLDLSLTDASKVKVTGTGLEGGRAGDTHIVNVDTNGAGEGGLALSISGPSEVPISCDDHEDGTATLTFTPTAAGDYQLDVKFSGEDVPGSLFSIPIIDPTQCQVSGSGVTGEGARVGAPAQLIVDTREAGPAPVEAKVTDPSGETQVVALEPTTEEGVFSGEYVPQEAGYYGLVVKCAGEEIPDSPFQVPICNPDVVQLAGPGLESGVANANNVIDVFTEGAGPGEVGIEFQTQDESAPPVDAYVTQVDDNHYQVNYTPHAVETVDAQVTYGGFPFGDKQSIPVCDPSKVKVDGPGVESGILANQEASFFIDTTEAGPGELSVEVEGPNGVKLDSTLEQVGPGQWEAKYTPTKAGDHIVNVKYSDHEVEGSPFFVEVCHPDAVKAYGPGLEKATVLEKATFTVDASEAGGGALAMEIEGPADCDINCKDIGNHVYEATYVAPKPGVYNIHLKFADKDVPGSPFEVHCERPPPDASKCIISGLENPGTFTVDCKDAGGTGLLEVGVCGAYVPVEFVSVKHNGDYTFSVSYDISEPGETTISVKWHERHLTGSPFIIHTQ